MHSVSESLILRNTTHTGPVRGLDFNPIQTNLLASGGINGEVRQIRIIITLSPMCAYDRFTFGISKIRASHTVLLLELAAPNSMKLLQSRGINRFSTFSPALAARDILSYGISEASARSLP